MKLKNLHEKYLVYRPRKAHRTPGDLTKKSAMQQTQDMTDLSVNLMPSMTSVTNYDQRGKLPRLRRQG